MPPYYRITLAEYEAFDEPIPIRKLLREYGEEIREDYINNKPSFYPFPKHQDTVRTAQGMYLAECTENLYRIFQEALGIQAAGGHASGTSTKSFEGYQDSHQEYAEARRRTREKFFFTRNPQLVLAAKKFRKPICEACEFDFHDFYGSLGEEYIEAHHLSPLSERPEREWSEELYTNLEGIALLCANCHRMIHRRRPALTLEELRKAIREARNLP